MQISGITGSLPGLVRVSRRKFVGSKAGEFAAPDAPALLEVAGPPVAAEE